MSVNEQYREAMGKALFLANRARETGDVPVGAVVVDADGHIIGRGWNCREAHHDPTGHAEIVALREAARALGTWRLTGCTLIVTLEPCTMCAGAILASRVDRVVFGAWDPKAGAAGSLRDVLRDARMPHPTEVIGGVLAQEAAMQLRSFFLGQRAANEMPVVEAPVHEPGDLPAPAPALPPAEDARANEPAPASSPKNSDKQATVYPSAPVAVLSPAATGRRAVAASPFPRRAGRPFSERVSGNGDTPADIAAGEAAAAAAASAAAAAAAAAVAASAAAATTQPPYRSAAAASAAAATTQPPYRSAAPVMPAVAPQATRGPITKSVPKIRPVHVRPTAVAPSGTYTPAQPKRPDAAALPEPPAPVVEVVAESMPPAPPQFPQRAQQRSATRTQRPLPQAFEPEARRVDYELASRQFSDVDAVISGIRARRSSRRDGSARH
ncbi:tRNA adenosine(34) deaminase TadA [Actinomyces sp.]